MKSETARISHEQQTMKEKIKVIIINYLSSLSSLIIGKLREN